MHAHSESSHPLNGDHLSICKFRKTEQDAFRIVWDKINWLMGEKPRILDRAVDPDNAKRALHSLCSDKFHGSFLAGNDPTDDTEDTCRWIADRREFRDFVQNVPVAGKRAQRLWIQGQEGCGKSYLSAQIITNLIPEDQQESVIHCFLSGSSPERGNIEALLRSTLHQALRLEPELVVKYLLEHFKEARDRDVHIEKIWTRERLILLWPVVMAAVMDRHPLILVIDGLGEIAPRCQRAFVGCLYKLDGETQNTKNLRMLVISGEGDILREGLKEHGFKTYQVIPEDTVGDIAKTANAKLGHLWRLESLKKDESKWREICDKIAKNAKGNYLWASLAAESLRHTAVSNAEELTNALEKLPATVEGLYEHILEGILRNRQKEASFIRLVLSWAMYQQEGLKVAEFNIIQAIGQALRQHPSQPLTKDKLEELLEPNIQAKVNFYCGQLVRFIDGRLELIHPSLKSYLATATTGHLSHDFTLEKTSANADLARICIAYLTMDTFRDAGQSLETPETLTSWESKVRKRIQVYGFVRYASLYWYKHVAEAGMDKGMWRHRETEEQQKILEDSSTGFGQSWTEVWWFLTRGPSQRYPAGFPAEKLVESARVVEVEGIKAEQCEELEAEPVPETEPVGTSQDGILTTANTATGPPNSAQTPQQSPHSEKNRPPEPKIEYRDVVKYIKVPSTPPPTPKPIPIPVPVTEPKPVPAPEEKLGYFKRVTKATKRLGKYLLVI